MRILARRGTNQENEDGSGKLFSSDDQSRDFGASRSWGDGDARSCRRPAEAGAVGVCLAHHRLYVPQHFQHEPEPRRAGRIRCDLRHLLRLRLGIEYRFRRRTSSSTTVSASPRNGATSPSTSRASTTPIRAPTISTISRRWAVRPGPAALGPLASRIIGRRTISSSSAILMRSRARLPTPSTNKLWNFFTPSISATVGFQSYEQNADDYVYWNAGLTLGFLERWSADIRYYDTDYNSRPVLRSERRSGQSATHGQWAPSRPRSRRTRLPQSTSPKGAACGALFYCDASAARGEIRSSIRQMTTGASPGSSGRSHLTV